MASLAELIQTRGAGVKVYRVVGGTPDPDGPWTWSVEAREIKIVRRDGAIVLRRSFTDMILRQFPSGALGRLFYVTEIDAVKGFSARQREAIEAAERARLEATEALGWALDWGSFLSCLKEKGHTPDANQ